MGYALAFVILLVAIAALAQLMFDCRCPVCQKVVSRRALLCPYCNSGLVDPPEKDVVAEYKKWRDNHPQS